jgi:uncharacterized membrane protein YgcG
MERPAKTFADYLVVAISPVLIMALVGSLAFFLVEVFYKSDMVHGVRWVMFWFVLAVVLVSRLGIEQSRSHAIGYGAALAVVTWIYLLYSHTAPVLAAVLLAITWWCAHRLTVDCTLINDDEDASGEGVLRGLWRRLEIEMSVEPLPPIPRTSPPGRIAPLQLPPGVIVPKRRPPPRAPGKWVIYFSLAALPLFGFGQLFLPVDPQSRRTGFEFLALYLAAALSLLMTTSFLGLRRYLRQRSVEMSSSIALGWVRFGVILAVAILVTALILPKPGATKTWKDFNQPISHKEHKASEYALLFNPPGEGDGAPSGQPNPGGQSKTESKNAPPGNGTQPTQNPNPSQSHNQSSDPGNGNGQSSGGQPGGSGGGNAAAPSGQSGGGGQGGEGNGNGQGEGNGDADGRERKPAEPPKEKPAGDVELPNKKLPQFDDDKLPKKEPAQQQQQKPGGSSAKSEKHPFDFHTLLKVLVILAIVAALAWLAIRYRKQIARALRAFVAAVREFFAKLFAFRRRKPAAAVSPGASPAVIYPFAEYENPFLTGKDKLWPAERLVLYTYAATRAWAKEQRHQLWPQETPREFCVRLSERFPEFGPELERLAYFYGHAAFARELPEDFDVEALRQWWHYMGDSAMAISAR